MLTTKDKFVGIDPSLSNTGVVIISSSEEVSYNSCVSPSKKVFGVARAVFLASKVAESLEGYDTESLFVVVEGPSYASKTSSLFELGELSGLIQYVLHNKGIEYIMPSPKEIKKHFTGNGNANKEMMLEKAETKISTTDMTEHEIDAYACAMFGKELITFLRREHTCGESFKRLLQYILVKEGIQERTKAMKGKVVNPKYYLKDSTKNILKNYI